jgi:hypothetical protein
MAIFSRSSDAAAWRARLHNSQRIDAVIRSIHICVDFPLFVLTSRACESRIRPNIS